jgi:hypothetical protein
MTIPDEVVDKHLDAVLRASGSSLRNYSMSTIKQAMRAAMREAMTATVDDDPRYTITPLGAAMLEGKK